MFLIGSIAKFSIQQFFFYYNYMYDIKELLSEKICYSETCLTPNKPESCLYRTLNKVTM